MAHRFRLVTLDLDGTLLATTCFLEVAKAIGKADEVRRLDELYLSGKMGLAENFHAEFGLLAGTPVARAEAALRQGPWMQRIPEGVADLRALGLRVGLLTDQPRVLASLAEPSLDPVLCSEGGVHEGKLGPPVEYREDKAANLRAWCKAHQVDLETVIHCGNGSNDIPVFERVGLAVAVNPASPEVARRADVALEGVQDLREVARAVEQALKEA